jgi:hypothetical protein
MVYKVLPNVKDGYKTGKRRLKTLEAYSGKTEAAKRRVGIRSNWKHFII